MPSYTVTDYLLDRLAEVGAGRLFGVPGDFTLAMLDHVERHPRVEWVGCANELGAGYAADGYARVTGVGAVCTTFGVGELSAINAIAGSFAEHVPVVHIVGAPATTTQAAGRATHHSLGDGDFRHFARMSAEVTCAQVALSVGDAAEQIDHLIAEVIERRLPGYILVPADVGEAAAEPPESPLEEHPGVTSRESLEKFRAAAAELLTGTSGVAVLADILVQRMGAQAQLDALLSSGVPHATLLWGRRVVDESAPGYLGTYVGAVSDPAVRDGIEGADVLIMAGVQFTDLTSGFFSQHLPAQTIDIGPHSARIGATTFGPIALPDALAAVAEIVGSSPRTAAGPRERVPHAGAPAPDSPLDQSALWDLVCDALRPGDIVLADQGTSFYGMGAHRLPHGVTFIGQPLWASIGFTLPASVGAALAAPGRRPWVLIGDGAAQLTAGDLGTLVRHGVNAVVVVVDNGGYTVERAIHGPEAHYNDIATWDWVQLAHAVDPKGSVVASRAATAGELEQALAAAALGSDRLTLIQAVTPALDVPPLLTALARAASAANTARP